MNTPTGPLAGLGAAVLWLLWCVRFFDTAEPWRPGLLEAIPHLILLLPCLILLGLWLDAHWDALAGPPLARPALMGLLLVVAALVHRRDHAGGHYASCGTPPCPRGSDRQPHR